jgi:hypothetical protein
MIKEIPAKQSNTMKYCHYITPIASITKYVERNNQAPSVAI